MNDAQEALNALDVHLKQAQDAPLAQYALVPIAFLEQIKQALASGALPPEAVVIRNPADRLFVQSLVDEAARARRKFPGNNHLLIALGEEYGETVKACLDESTPEVYVEAVQTAAMALRLATEGDPTLNAHRAGKGFTPLGGTGTANYAYSAEVKVGL